MLRRLRSPEGGPALRVRVIAVVLVIGLLLAAAPLLIPFLQWIGSVLRP